MTADQTDYFSENPKIAPVFMVTQFILDTGNESSNHRNFSTFSLSFKTLLFIRSLQMASSLNKHQNRNNNFTYHVFARAVAVRKTVV